MPCRTSMRHAEHAPRRLAAALTLLALGTASGAASAELGFQAHGEIQVARMTGAPKSSEFGWGATALVAPELTLGSRIGLELPLGFIALEPLDGLGPKLTPSSVGAAFVALPGLRVRVLVEPGASIPRTLWIAGGGGLTLTGSRACPALDIRGGLDFTLGRFSLGPAVGYVQVIETKDGLLPEDARILTFGVHAVLDFPRKAARAPAPDRDGDAVPDALDKCPDQPETVNGIDDEDGCPELDEDGDGILGSRDKCPNEPEDKDGFEDDDGCPDPDNDHDGIADVIDKCPNEPETMNGFQDDDGCPDVAPPSQREIHVELGEPILFDFDKSDLEPAETPKIEAIARALAAHPEYTQATIEGYADEVGDEKYNLGLSDRRATAVKSALVRAGIVPTRLTTIARGKIGSHRTTGSPTNRRAEVAATRVHDEAAPPAPAAPAKANDVKQAPKEGATAKPGGAR